MFANLTQLPYQHMIVAILALLLAITLHSLRLLDFSSSLLILKLYCFCSVIVGLVNICRKPDTARFLPCLRAFKLSVVFGCFLFLILPLLHGWQEGLQTAFMGFMAVVMKEVQEVQDMRDVQEVQEGRSGGSQTRGEGDESLDRDKQQRESEEKEKQRRERRHKRKRTRGEDERLLERIEEGYFLVRQSVVQPNNAVGLVYSNRKAQEMLQDTRCSFEELLESLAEVEETSRPLKGVLSEFCADETQLGMALKGHFAFVPQKFPARDERPSNVSEAGEGRIIDGEERPKCTRVPFAHYKARLLKLSKTDVLLILVEDNPKDTLGSLEGLKSILSCTLSHELRTLSNGIIGNVELLLDSGTLNKSQKIQQKTAYCAAFLLTRKLNDFLDYIQLQNRGFKLHYSEFPLEDVMFDVSRVCKWLTKQKQLKFAVERRGALPQQMVGDKDRIEQILMNLLSKAIEFTSYGRIVLVVSAKEEKRIVFKVNSHGGSMQAKLAEQMKLVSPTERKKQKARERNGPLEAVQNLDALSLQISEILCQELGSNVSAKNVGSELSQLKFSVINGFPKARSKAFAEFRVLRRSRTNMRFCQKATTRHPVAPLEIRPETHNPPHDEPHSALLDRSFYGGMPVVRQQSITIINLKRTEPVLKPSNPTRQASMDQLQVCDEIPSEMANSSGITLPPNHATRAFHNTRQDSAAAKSGSPSDRKCRDSPSSAALRNSNSKSRARRTTLVEPELHRVIKPLGDKSMDDEQKCTMLIVDDDTINRLVLKSLLKKFGYNSIEARDGKEAVCFVERYLNASKLPELKVVFMDLQMPVMNGIEATAEIVRLCRSNTQRPPPIIGVSADPLEEDRGHFLAAGIQEFVAKPIDHRKIQYILHKYIPR